MNQDGDLYRAVHPEGTHMASSKSDGDAHYGAYLDDETNELGGQTKFYKVDSADEDSGGGEAGPDLSTVVLVLALGIAAGVVATIVVQKATPRIKLWWIDSAFPALKSRWTSLAKWKKGKSPAALLELAAPVKIEPAVLSKEIAVVIADDRTSMSDIEAQRRFLAMMLAAAFAAEQLRVLKTARIEHPEKLRELKRAASELSAQQTVDVANRMLEADDSLLDDESRAVFVEVFSGGGKVDGKYVPLRHEVLEEAMRLPEEEVRTPGSADLGDARSDS